MSPQGIDGRSLRLGGWLCGTWLLAATACDPGTAPTPDHFRFRPPDGTRFVQKLVVTRQQEFTGGPKQSNVSASRTEFVFERTHDGYRVRAESKGSEYFRNGEAVEDPVTDLLRRIPGEFELDPNGRLRAIHGFENVADRIVLELPAELAMALEPVLTEERLLEAGRREWRERYERFIGRRFRVGEIWTSSSSIQRPDGSSLTEFRAVWFSEWKSCGTRNCLRMLSWLDTDLESLKRRVAEEVPDRAAELFADLSAGSTSPPAGSFRVHGRIERLVDPSTLLPYAEHQTRSTRRTTPGPSGKPLTLTIEETKEYTFDYR